MNCEKPAYLRHRGLWIQLTRLKCDEKGIIGYTGIVVADKRVNGALRRLNREKGFIAFSKREVEECIKRQEKGNRVRAQKEALTAEGDGVAIPGCGCVIC